MYRSVVYGPKYKDSQNEKIEYGSSIKAEFRPGYVVKNDGEKFPEGAFLYVKDLGDNWEKGHLLAKRFGGSDGSENMLPMTSAANDKFRAEVENKLALLLKHFSLLKSAHLAQLHTVSTIVYEVIVSDDKINVNGINIPKSFKAKIDVKYVDGARVEYNIINQNIKVYTNGLKLPLCLEIPTNLAKDNKEEDISSQAQ